MLNSPSLRCHYGNYVFLRVYPDFSKLTASSILVALGMSLFTLSVGLGIILTYGSYMKNSEDSSI